MKKTLTLSLGTMLAISASPAQTPERLVLLEQFTQASCPPCAEENPRVDAILEENQGKMIAIKYQVSWPGYDPMYNHNKIEVDDRVNYYKVNAVPWSVLDGKQMAVHEWGSNEVETRRNVPPPFSVDVKHSLSEDKTTINAEVKIKALKAIGGNLVAHVTIVEREIVFDEPPGSNGEKVFLYVMKKKLPDKVGTALPAVWNAGEEQVINVSWKLKNVYDIDELAVVAYVQDNAAQEVHQAGYSPSAKETGHTNTEVNETSSVTLHAAYPNPAALATKITFNAPVTSYMSLDVYNTSGQLIERINLEDNQRSLIMDVSGYPAGMYCYRIAGYDHVGAHGRIVITR